MFRYFLIITVLIASLVIILMDWKFSLSPSTDIAFVDGLQYRPASNVKGFILSQKVSDGDRVRIGQPLFVIDSKLHESSYLKLEQEKIDLQSDLKNREITIPNMKLQLSSIEDSLLNTVKVMKYTQYRLNQFKLLGSKVSQTVVDNTTFEFNRMHQQLSELNDSKIKVEKSIAISVNEQTYLKEKIKLINRRIVLQAQIKKDYLIRSPINGVVNSVLVKEGELASIGKPLIDIVDYENRYITAYFIESSLKNISIGQKVAIKFDAYDDIFMGEVILIGAVSGAKVSGITPNYSSGSFTRLAQKIPVRISFKTKQNLHVALGMSAKVTIK